MDEAYPTDAITTWANGWRTLGNEDGTHFVYVLMRPHPSKPIEDALVTIYVGYTNNPVRRLREHAASKWWWPAVDLDQSFLLGFPSKQAALEAEAQYIWCQCPEMNRAGRLALVVAL